MSQSLGCSQVLSGMFQQNGSKIRLPVPNLRAMMSQEVRPVLPPRRESKMNPAQITTVANAAR